MKKETAHHPLSALALIPCLFSVATSASAEVRCAPTVSPTHVRPGGAITLQGNCRDFSAENPDGIPLTQGAEAWQIALASGNASVGQRSLPDGNLTVTAPTIPGEQRYVVTSIEGYGGPIDLGGEGGFPSVTVTVDETAAPSAPTLDQLSTALTGLQTQRVRSRLNETQAHLRTLRASAAMPLFDVQGVPLPEGKKEAASPQRLGVYVGGFGDYLRQNASATRSELKARTVSLSLGADYRLDDAWVMGANIGVSDSHATFSGSSSDQKSKGKQATAYASWSLSPTVYVTATLSYEVSKFDTVRDSGSGQLSIASPRGRGLGVSLSGGQDFAFGPWSIGPYVRVDSVTSDIDAFEEHGSEAAVSVGAQRTRSNTFNIGAQTQLSVPVSWGVVLPYLRLEASRRSDSTQQAATATLLSDNTALLVPSDADTRGSYGSVALGVSGVNQGGISWFADWENGIAQKGYRTQRFGFGLRFEL